MRSLSWCALLVIVGCSKHEPPAPAPRVEPRSAPTASPPSAARPPQPKAAGGLIWDAPTLLVQREPRSPVRAAEYGVGGEPNAELSVFHFGEEKVSIEGQIRAWVIQFEQPDGSDTAQQAKRGELKVGPLAIDTVEIHGNFTGPVMMPNAQVAPSNQDWALLGAIVSGPKGPVMFKLIGPRVSVERARSAYEQLLHSVRPE
jgi:hypothetical protein